MAADDDELEYTLLNKREVMVYQIPPASSSSGHKADDWKKCIWRGRCQIAGKGPNMSIKLLDATSGNLFAQCMIPNGEHEKYVERAVDSSRYFVLKITNGARHAFIGLGFEDRNDAFDFNVTLSGFKSTWVTDQQAEEASSNSEPAKDLSLKEGQKITINLENLGIRGGRRREEKAESNGDSGFIGLLAPPPPGGASRKQPGAALAAPVLQPVPVTAAAPVAGARAVAAQDDFFGGDDFDDFQSSASAAAGAIPAPAHTPAFSTSSPARAAAPVSDLAAQLGQLGFGAAADPFAPAKPAPAPVAAPAPSIADPFATRPSVATPQPIGFAPMAPAAVQQRSAPAPSFDPFGNLGMFGSSSSPPAAAPAPATQRSNGRNDPFDEFDIFK